mmetsp:Transcript_22022/g.56097  ORF Transcript_22022/g.56097 Transcript_22022/m.56097 type:complete len:257 (+) Transcript_22022:3-773(+)
MSEPVMKVTDVPFDNNPFCMTSADMPQAAHTMSRAGKTSGAPKEADQLGSHVVKRWTADILERGAGRNKGRMFDNIPQASIGPKDWEPLELRSSMEPIRSVALKKQAEDRKNAWLKRSAMSKSSVHDTVDGSEGSQADESVHISMMSRSMTTAGPRKGTAPGSVVEPKAQASRQGSKRTTKPGGGAPVFGADSQCPLAPQMSWADATAEPRFFGSVTSLTRPASETAIRCGGFTRDISILHADGERTAARARRPNR